MSVMQSQLVHARVLVKLSGEALGNTAGAGLDLSALAMFVEDFIQLKQLGVEIIIVVGGGNYLRGANFAEQGFDRVAADHMGMLFTVANGLALRAAFRSAGVDSVLYSAMGIPGMVDVFAREKALDDLNAGKIVISTAGIGAPLVSTDVAASLRAIELNADIILKASTVDGVYTADPKKDKSAKRFDKLDYDTVIEGKLRVMDLPAIHLCQDHDMPIRVFDMRKPSVLRNIVLGLEQEGTLISN